MDDADDGQHVRAPTVDDLVGICRAFNENSARYLLIGGFAVIAHGGGRTTKDIDFLVDASPENVARLKAALRVLPDNAAAEIGEHDIEKYQVVRVADEVLVDLLAEACGISYDDAVEDSEILELGDVSIPIASKKTLIATKQTVRPSDQLDREFLASLIEEEER